MSDRTPTPYVDQIWDQNAKIDRWHQLWIEHLQAQKGLNPNHPDHNWEDLGRYRKAAEAHQDNGGQVWGDAIALAEKGTRHDVAAALEVFNYRAAANTAHLGLTSHDIVDVANQIATRESLAWVIEVTSELAEDLAQRVDRYRAVPLVARTHGQPAQLTTYGHRLATVLSPLLDWIHRAQDGLDGYPMRPPHGAVGTGADLQRVLEGWGNDPKAPERPLEATGSVSSPSAGTETAMSGIEALQRLWRGRPDLVCTRCGTEYYRSDEHSCDPAASTPLSPSPLEVYTAQIAARCGFTDTMGATRQTYHRSYDLHIAALLTELASIAQTWANDRRLEAMLGLGRETRDPDQVGSSAMAHKTNPVLCERIVSLTAVTRGYMSEAAELAGGEWLEGDVSGSGARRHWLPGIFKSIAEILVNWDDAMDRWEVHTSKLAIEVDEFEIELSSGAVLQFLVERGFSRDEGHRMIREALGKTTPTGYRPAMAAHYRFLLNRLAGGPDFQVQLRGVMRAACRVPVGTVEQQIDALLFRVGEFGQRETA